MVVFLYLMIHLWLWIVQPYKNGISMSLFDSLTKPFNPDVNNDSETILDSLLFTAKNRWKIDQEQILESMNKIAYHETGGSFDPYQQQYDGGPGRGLYQFEQRYKNPETGEYEQAGGMTAANRLIEMYEEKEKEIPDWLMQKGMENPEIGFDASLLNEQQQQQLFLANALRNPNKEEEGYGKAGIYDIDGDKTISNEELADYWTQYHHAGTKPNTDAYTDQRNKFLEHLESYGK